MAENIKHVFLVCCDNGDYRKRALAHGKFAPTFVLAMPAHATSGEEAPRRERTFYYVAITATKTDAVAVVRDEAMSPEDEDDDGLTAVLGVADAWEDDGGYFWRILRADTVAS